MERGPKNCKVVCYAAFSNCNYSSSLFSPTSTDCSISSSTRFFSPLSTDSFVRILVLLIYRPRISPLLGEPTKKSWLLPGADLLIIGVGSVFGDIGIGSLLLIIIGLAGFLDIKYSPPNYNLILYDILV